MREREEWDEGSAGCGEGHAQNKTKQHEDRKPRKKEHTNGTTNRETEKGRLIDSSTHHHIDEIQTSTERETETSEVNE